RMGHETIGVTTLHSRDTMCPRLWQEPRPLIEKRAQGRPGAGRTRSLVCSKGSTRVNHHRFDRNIRPSLRDGVNAYFRALPGVHDLLVTVVFRSSPEGLAPAQGAPGPHDFVVRQALFVRAVSRALNALASIASRDPRFVTIGRNARPMEAGCDYDKQNLRKMEAKSCAIASKNTKPMKGLANSRSRGSDFASKRVTEADGTA